MQDYNDVLKNEDSDPENQGCLTDLMYDLIDEMSLGMSFEVHRAAKIGILFLDETDSESQKQYELVNEKGLDIFGQVPTKKQYECVCPSCGRNMAASRFAPHLEKCMGMGRNSSRIASRRIANANQKKDSGDESDENGAKEEEWGGDRKAKRVKRDIKSNNNHTKKGKSAKLKNGEGHGGSSDNVALYEAMTLEEKKALLMSTCGVISEHTKKMCTKSLRCPQHSDALRREVRQKLLCPLSTRDEFCEPAKVISASRTSYVTIDSQFSSSEDNTSQDDDSSFLANTLYSVVNDTFITGQSVLYQDVIYDHLYSFTQSQVSIEADEPVDIDTYNEEDGQSLVQTLQWEAVSNPSPADSNSTTGSVSRKKKGKATKKKSCSSKGSTASRSGTPCNQHELT